MTAYEKHSNADSVNWFQGGRVLLVEDRDVTPEAVKRVFETCDLTVSFAHQGSEALALIEHGQYDLILTALEMPGMDGFEMTRRIRALENGKKTPIVAMSNDSFKSDLARCIDAGMNDYIVMPVDPVLLYQTLAHWLLDGCRAPDQVSGLIGTGHSHGQPLTGTAICIDTANGLNYFAGDLAQYQKLLRLFVQTRREEVRQISEALGGGNWGEARRMAHSLKSVAATIGAETLRKRAGELEQRLRIQSEHADLTALINVLEESLAAVCLEIELFLPH